MTLITTTASHWIAVSEAAMALDKGKKITPRQKAQAADWADACKALASRLEKA
jgi:hypothetical protein